MEIFVNVDDIYDLWVNGSLLGHNDQWDVAQCYVVPVASDNLIALKCINTGGPMGAVVEVRIDGAVVFTSGDGWRWNASPASGWSGSGFNDQLWQPVTDLGGYGASPWGTGISQFPQSSAAHWIWGAGDEVYLRGSFQANTSTPSTQPPTPLPPDTLADDHTLPPTPPTDSAGIMEIVIDTDDAYTLWVNGAYAGENDQWDQAQRYTLAAMSGENTVAVRGHNRGSGPRGLIAQIMIDGMIVLQTGSDWRHSATDTPGWQNPGFDDSSWALVRTSGTYGVAPWGQNISGFPAGSQAHWIWGEGQVEHFRGRFNYNGGMQALKVRSGDQPAVASDGFVLSQSYPNPFNPSTAITFDQPRAGWVKLTIYDIRGKEVAVLIDGLRQAGHHTQIWQAVDMKGLPVSSGVYFYRLKLADRELIGKLSLVR